MSEEREGAWVKLILDRAPYIAEKPFKCDICSTAFADRFALKRHRGIHDKYGGWTDRPVEDEGRMFIN